MIARSQRTASFSFGRLAALALGAAAFGVACAGASPVVQQPCAPALDPTPAGSLAAVVSGKAPPTAADADEFVRQVNADLLALASEADRMSWVKATYITPDTEALEAKAQERVMEYLARKIKEARVFASVPNLSADTARALYLLKFSAGLPAPEDAKERAELAELASKLEGVYGRGKACSPKFKGQGKDKQRECLELERRAG